MSPPSRRGFTVVELLVVVVLGAFVVLASYEVLISNSRTHRVNNAHVQGQQALRASLDVLFGELREISTPDGDLLQMGPTSLTIRSQRAFGLVCSVNYGTSPPRLTALRSGQWFEAGDSIVVLADNDPALALDDVWLHRAVQTVDTTAQCGGSQAQIMAIGSLASSGDTVRIGAPIRALEVFTYGLFQIGADWYLGRQVPGAEHPDPLVGPLVQSRGLEFRYLDSIGAETAVRSSVSQIEVTVRYQAEGARDPQGRLVSDSLMTRIRHRNRRTTAGKERTSSPGLTRGPA